MALDIDISHYNTGTATVAANGTVVTGQGTTWTVLRKGDMFGTHVGDGVRILSVDSNTQLTLAHPWPGVAQTAAAYEIQRTPYDVGYLEAIETLLRRWGGGNVDALAGLDGTGGNQGIVFTGAGAAETFPLTAFARTLLEDANAAEAVSTLGLLPVQSSETDATANRLLRTGAFGLGIQLVSTEANLNNYLVPGKYITPATITNAPPGWPSGLRGVIEVAGGASYSSQIITRPDTGESYIRGSLITAFTPWRGLSSSMTSNANGVCFRFAGGLQICWQPSILLTYVNPSVLGALWTYPAAFASTPFLTITPTAQPIASHRESTAYTLPYASTSSGRLELIDNAASYPVGSTQAANGLAIGLY